MEHIASFSGQQRLAAYWGGLSQGRFQGQPGSAEAPGNAAAALNVLRLTLGNHSNLCYMNSFVQALLWTAELQLQGETRWPCHWGNALFRNSSWSSTILHQALDPLTWNALIARWPYPHRPLCVAVITFILCKVSGRPGNFRMGRSHKWMWGTPLSLCSWPCPHCHLGSRQFRCKHLYLHG